MKFPIKRILIFIGIAVFLLIIIDFLWNALGFKLHYKQKAHAVTYTNFFLRDMSSLIQTTIIDTETALPNNIADITEWLRHHCDDFDYYQKRYEDLSFIFSSSGEIIDRWGNPLVLIINSPNEYILISWGPNEKFDGGRKDDIVYKFDPYLLIKEKQPADE
jgi:hypothetical protein